MLILQIVYHFFLFTIDLDLDDGTPLERFLDPLIFPFAFGNLADLGVRFALAAILF